MAASSGDLVLVQQCLDAGVDPNAADSVSGSPACCGQCVDGRPYCCAMMVQPA